MSTTLERFLLPLLAAVLITFVLVNPKSFLNLGQQISAAICIIALAFLIGFTIERMRAQPSNPKGESKKKTTELNPQVLSKKSNSNKSWLLDEDKALILEVVVPKLSFDTGIELALPLYPGDSIAVQTTNFELSGVNLHKEFAKAWAEGKIDFSSNGGMFDPLEGVQNLFIKAIDVNGNEVRRPVVKFDGLHYEFKKEYYLGNSALLPTSSEVEDFETKIQKRIFFEKDLRLFSTKNFKKYTDKAKIPHQSSNILYFLHEPEPISDSSTGVVKIRYRNN